MPPCCEGDDGSVEGRVPSEAEVDQECAVKGVVPEGDVEEVEEGDLAEEGFPDGGVGVVELRGDISWIAAVYMEDLDLAVGHLGYNLYRALGKYDLTKVSRIF